MFEEAGDFEVDHGAHGRGGYEHGRGGYENGVNVGSLFRRSSIGMIAMDKEGAMNDGMGADFERFLLFPVDDEACGYRDGVRLAVESFIQPQDASHAVADRTESLASAGVHDAQWMAAHYPLDLIEIRGALDRLYERYREHVSPYQQHLFAELVIRAHQAFNLAESRQLESLIPDITFDAHITGPGLIVSNALRAEMVQQLFSEVSP